MPKAAKQTLEQALQFFKRVSTGKTALFEEQTQVPRFWHDIVVKVSKANNSYFAILIDGEYEFVRTSTKLYEALQSGEYAEGESLSAELHYRAAIKGVAERKLGEYSEATQKNYRDYLEQGGNFFYATSIEATTEDDE